MSDASSVEKYAGPPSAIQAATQTAILASIKAAIATYNGDSRRAFHGRGHCFPGYEAVCVDLFAPIVWVSLFDRPVPDAEADAGAEEGGASAASRFSQNKLDKLLPEIADCIDGSAFNSVLVQHRYERPCRVSVAHGSLPEGAVAAEQGATYELMLEGNQNIGFFLDAEPARAWLRANCNGDRVLNLFAYTCAFSVAAVQGGAQGVVNIDMSRSAMRTGERNHSRNFSPEQLERTRVKFFPHEIFRSISRLEKNGPYDTIIVDPPSRQPGSFEVDRDYPKLLRKLPRLLRPGGKVLCMLNAPNRDQSFLHNMVSENYPELRFLKRLGNSPDFPDESRERQLKMLLFDLPKRAKPEKPAAETEAQTQ